MTVQELIDKLEKVEDKNRDLIMRAKSLGYHAQDNAIFKVSVVFEETQYYDDILPTKAVELWINTEE